MKKLYTLLLISNICTMNAMVDYFVNHTNPNGCNYLMRQESSRVMNLDQQDYVIENEHNGDDTTVTDFAGSFSKTLEHDATTGILTANGQSAYRQMLTYIASSRITDSNAITRAPGATRKLVSPQAAFTRSLTGVAPAIIPMPSAPLLSSSHAAAEMIEVYLKAICRDVNFAEYGTDTETDVDTINGGSKTNNAAAILTALGDNYKGPRNEMNVVTAAELFRGTTQGDLVGPYISQFLYHPIYHLFQNSVTLAQHISIAQSREFGVTFEDFVAIQNGTVPKEYKDSDFNGTRYIINGRDAGTAVHSDGPGEFFLNAANILLQAGAPISPMFPYNNGTIINEAAFVNMTGPDIYTAVMGCLKEALKHAWNHKWRGSRKLRPEAMAGLVHRAQITNTNPYNLPNELFATLGGINVLNWVQTNNTNQHNSSTYLLPLLYPEGSPTHPSYPAGHAVVAGACTTILKAFFDTDATFASFGLAPVQPNPNNPEILIELVEGDGSLIITVGGELDKLASNVALSRNFAGVHYRSDGDEGILLGEQVALYYLQDYARMYTEDGFTGFILTRRNGQRVRITPDAITIIG